MLIELNRLVQLRKVFVPLVVPSICYSAVTNMTKKTAVVVLTKGAEDMEFVISVDVLRRAGVSCEEYLFLFHLR